MLPPLPYETHRESKLLWLFRDSPEVPRHISETAQGVLEAVLLLFVNADSTNSIDFTTSATDLSGSSVIVRASPTNGAWSVTSWGPSSRPRGRGTVSTGESLEQFLVPLEQTLREDEVQRYAKMVKASGAKAD